MEYTVRIIKKNQFYGLDTIIAQNTLSYEWGIVPVKEKIMYMTYENQLKNWFEDPYLRSKLISFAFSTIIPKLLLCNFTGKYYWEFEVVLEFEKFGKIEYGECKNFKGLEITKSDKFRPEGLYEIQYFGWNKSHTSYYGNSEEIEKWILEKNPSLLEGYHFVEYGEGHIDGWGHGSRAGLRIEKI